jgi:DNA-binding transcriptional regulator LsrR (DeoR family)
MPAERLSMRKVREVLRLKYACGVSARVISRSLGIGRTVVGEHIRRAAVVAGEKTVMTQTKGELPALVSCAGSLDRLSVRVTTAMQAAPG